MTSADRRARGGLLLATVLAASLLASCILVIPAPAERLGGTCRLTDDERKEDCGQCVEESCQDQLDACCGAGDACEPAIHDIVACEPFSDCDPVGSSEAETALRACRARSCADECILQGETGVIEPNARGDAGSDAGGVVCNDVGDGCLCQVGTDERSSGSCKPPNNDEPYVCCASSGYPSTGGCTCYPIGCGASADGCVCGQQAYETQSQLCDLDVSDEGTCCSNGEICDCDDSRYECPEGSTVVSLCSTSRVGCAAGEKEVSSCAK